MTARRKQFRPRPAPAAADFAAEDGLLREARRLARQAETALARGLGRRERTALMDELAGLIDRLVQAKSDIGTRLIRQRRSSTAMNAYARAGLTLPRRPTSSR